MNEQPGWMPTDSEFRAHDRGIAKLRLFSDALLFYRALVRGAVEKALAEQREEIGKQIVLDNGAWTRRLAEQEARHKREVLRAKIAVLRDLLSDERSSDGYDAAAEMTRALRAELAALESGAK